jgi:hypothetical protein
MARNRTGLAPWSLAREAGIESATVDGRIEVPQYVQPTLNTGFVDEKGDWKGAKSNDKDFRAFQIDEAVGNGGDIITPSANPDGSWPLNMTGYNDIFIAIKPTNAGNYTITAVMGPADTSFANLNPVNAAATLKGNVRSIGSEADFEILVSDTESLTADVWNIFMIQERLADQKLLQFKIQNASGDVSTIETAFMRLV